MVTREGARLSIFCYIHGDRGEVGMWGLIRKNDLFFLSAAYVQKHNYKILWEGEASC